MQKQKDVNLQDQSLENNDIKNKTQTKLVWELKNSSIKKILGVELWWSRFLILKKHKRKFIY